MRIKLSILALFVFLLTAALTSATAQNAPTVINAQIPVGQIGGAANAVVFNSGNLYFNIGPRIARLAVLSTAPLTPTLPAAYGDILPGVPTDIKIANGYLYVALGKGGVAVVDPATLQTLSLQTLPVPSAAAAVAVGSQQLYVAAGNDGIIGYDLGGDMKTLTYAQTKSFTSPVRRITDVEVRSIGGGQYLFASGNNFAATVADRGGVMKFDITSSATLADPVKSIQLDINALALTDTFVFAVGDTNLYALDTTEIGSTGGVSSTVALAFRGLSISLRPGNADAYVSTNVGSVDVVSIGTPSPAPALAVIGSLFTGDFVASVAPAEFVSDPNTYLYLAHYGSGLSIASAPQAAPGTVNLDRPSYLLPKPGVASVVAGANSQAYVYSIPSTQWTINTTNLNALTSVGSGLPSMSTINAITPYTNSLLVSADVDGLARYLIDPVGDPILTDTVSTAGSAFDAAVAWPNAIVANGTDGLAVVDLSDPFTMTLIGGAPSPNGGSFTRVAVQGNYAYVADSGIFNQNAAFRIYDLVNPITPAPTGLISQTGILDVKLSGNLAFLAVGANGIRVADVTNPAAPFIINTDDYTGTTSAQSLAVYKHYLFVTGDTGVQMLSFDPAGQLSLITTIPTSGSAGQLTWVPGQLYVADDLGGLFVIQIGNDVQLTKTAPSTAYAGQAFTYTLSATNIGETPATGVIITDTLPENFSLVSAQNCTADTSMVTCTAGNPAMGATASYEIVVSTTVAGTYTNTAAVTSTELDVDALNNIASAELTVLPVADLTLSKIDAPDPVYVGSRLAYTLTVNNSGPSNATGVVVTDTLPAGVTLASASVGCAGAATLVCNVGALDSGKTVTVSIVVTVTPGAASIITNTAVATANEMDFSPASVSASTAVLSLVDLTLSQEDVPDPVYVGSRLTYTVTLGNVGPSNATGVILTDTLPAGVTLASASAGCSGTTTVVCNVGALNSGANTSVSIAVSVTASAASVITNNVVATASEIDFSPVSSSASTTVLPVVDLTLSKSDVPDPVYVGSRLTYTLNLGNSGPSNATGVVVTDTLPAGVTLASASAGCSGTTTVVCNVGALNSGANTSVSIAVTVTANAASVITNTALAKANEIDFSPASASASTTVVPVADLSITKTAVPVPATIYRPLTYTLTINNLGPSTASHVMVTDTLPTGVQFASVSGACTGTTTIVCNLGNLNSGANTVVTIVVTPTVANTTLNNSATVSSDVFDPNLSNNTTGAIPTQMRTRILLPMIWR